MGTATAAPRAIDARKALRHLRAADPIMAGIIAKSGPFRLREDGPNPFRSLARAIIYQQLSGKAAGTIYARFVDLFQPKRAGRAGTPPPDPSWTPLAHPFPEPRAVLRATDARLRSAGLSRQKIAAVRDLARHFASGSISTDRLHEWDDEAVIEHLTQVHGIGRWSAEMFLMFHLRRPDVLPVNDLGINRAISQSYGEKWPVKPDVVKRIGAPWRPWATVACWYLWRSQDTKI